MATLVLAAAGAALAPAGYAAVGWAVGSLVGNLLFPPKGPSTEGPRLNDLKVQAATYGVMIPLDFGTVSHAGNMIWSTDRREQRHEEEVGGKGGPSATSVTYTYTIDMAIGLSDRSGIDPIIGVRKILRDGKLWYSAGDDADAQTIMASNAGAAGIKVYTGSETQLPDPTMEAALGVGNVPAYRGLAYIVFTDLDLPNGQMSNWEFEVVCAGSDVGLRRLIYIAGGPNLTESPDLPIYEGGIVHVHMTDGTPPHKVGYLPAGRRYTFDANGMFISSHPWTYPAGWAHATAGFRAWGQGYIGATPAWVIQVNDGTPYGVILWLNDVPLAYSKALSSALDAVAVDQSAAELYLFRKTGASTWYEVYDESGRMIRTYSHSIALHPSATGPIHIGSNEGWMAIEGEYLWFIPYLSVGFELRLYQRAATGDYALIATTMTSPGASNEYTMIAKDGVCWVFSRDQVAIYTRHKGVTISSVTRASILTELCKRAGLVASDINMIALTGSEDGYTVGRPGAIRNAIEPLQKAGFFDVVESDGKLKFVTRGAAAAVTIPQDDLAAHEWGTDAPAPITLTRAQELELPRQVTVNFVNRAQNYEQGSQYARRLLTDSDIELVEELSIVMSDTRAAQVADVLLYDAHTQRNRIGFATTRKYAKYEPTDIVNLATDVATYPVRITRKEENGPIIKWDALAEAQAIYASDAVGTAQPARSSQIALRGPTRLELLDIPLLRDQDDSAGPYVAMSGYLDAWTGATLYKSADDLTYTAAGSVTSDAVMGAADTVLGNFAGGNTLDEANIVRVTVMPGQTLASVTLAQLLAGANAAILGAEILQFRDATLVSGRTYDLRGLLRGRRGTEQHMGAHAIGERFVMLSTRGMLRLDSPSAEIGLTRYYKAVTFAQALAAAGAQALTLAAVSLKPLAPVLPGAGKNGSGDILLQWMRRTRIGAEWRDLVDASLGEASEAYEVDIYADGTFATLKRTLSGLSSPAATYTAAQQTTDFGGAQSQVHCRIYQLSATVGRGIALQASITGL